MYKHFFKRAIDLLLSFIGIIVLIPVWLILTIAIFINDPGPIFFTQKRVGKKKKLFKILKFRTMKTSTPHDMPTHMLENPEQYITKVGGFLRKTSLDELPQIFNILKGDMSIVGPRPHMLYHTELYTRLIPHYMDRHAVRPGITGLAQVTGFRGETRELWQMEGRVLRDLWYINHWTPALDFRIIIMTVRTIFIHDGKAY